MPGPAYQNCRAVRNRCGVKPGPRQAGMRLPERRACQAAACPKAAKCSFPRSKSPRRGSPVRLAAGYQTRNGRDQPAPITCPAPSRGPLCRESRGPKSAGRPDQGHPAPRRRASGDDSRAVKSLSQQLHKLPVAGSPSSWNNRLARRTVGRRSQCEDSGAYCWLPRLPWAVAGWDPGDADADVQRFSAAGTITMGAGDS